MPERRRLRVVGIVQGVGFRPFTYTLAIRLGLRGTVLNDGTGVTVEVEGEQAALEEFSAALVAEAPPLARIDHVESATIAPTGESGFRILASTRRGGSALIPADIATCDECLAELADPADRRYRYPFINCTQCGPRFTIVRGVPYDRALTTMAGFRLCAACRREYDDPLDRRYHAEPVCCPACGPRLSMTIEDALRLLHEGAILAVKGLGGFHLACDAANEGTVARLRARKHREDKAFALMTPSPEELAVIGPAEGRLLRSRERPIVLLRAIPGAPVAASVAPGSPELGLMLPYTPLHHLLCVGFGSALVMTSANRSDEPVVHADADLARIEGIADAVLTHDRPIHRRCEDSVLRTRFPVRRSRGYVPGSLALPVGAPAPLLATGGELKCTFCVVRGSDAFLSPHLGDLEGELAYRAFVTDLELYLAMLDVRPQLIAHDLHPDYLSTRWAQEREVELLGVQHHHAHAAACLAENGETGPALALVFDGTGFGTDGTLWGGELLRVDLRSFERLRHLEATPLPGGEAAIRQPWRGAAAQLERAGLPVPWERWPLIRQSLRVNAPLSSGMGRLFDAVAAILGLRETVSYEGQAAVELERLADTIEAAPYDWALGDPAPLIRLIAEDLGNGRARAQIAAAFHETIAAAAATACADAERGGIVALSGGSFQNLRLLASTTGRLEALGFHVLTHRLVPPNDGGLSYGQAAIAAAAMR